MNGALRVLLLIGFLCLALLVYFAMLAQTAIALLRTGTPAAVALGAGVLGLPVIAARVTHGRAADKMRHAALQQRQPAIAGAPGDPGEFIAAGAREALG